MRDVYDLVCTCEFCELINAWRSAEAAGGPIFFKPDRGSTYARCATLMHTEALDIAIACPEREPKGKEGKAGKGSQFGGHS